MRRACADTVACHTVFDNPGKVMFCEAEPATCPGIAMLLWVCETLPLAPKPCSPSQNNSPGTEKASSTPSTRPPVPFCGVVNSPTVASLHDPGTGGEPQLNEGAAAALSVEKLYGCVMS